MKYQYANRPGFLLGFVDFFTAGLFFVVFMQLGLQDELDEILGHETRPYWLVYGDTKNLCNRKGRKKLSLREGKSEKSMS